MKQRQRLELWEIRNGVHCSVIGTCLGPADVKAVLRKARLEREAGAPDYQVHGFLVNEAARQGPVGRVIDAHLGRKYAGAIRQSLRLGGDPRLVAGGLQARGDRRSLLGASDAVRPAAAARQPHFRRCPHARPLHGRRQPRAAGRTLGGRAAQRRARAAAAEGAGTGRGAGSGRASPDRCPRARAGFGPGRRNGRGTTRAVAHRCRGPAGAATGEAGTPACRPARAGRPAAGGQ